MIYLKIILNWILRQINSFVLFVLENKLEKEKKEAQDAVQKAEDDYSTFQSNLLKYEWSDDELREDSEELLDSSGESEKAIKEQNDVIVNQDAVIESQKQNLQELNKQADDRLLYEIGLALLLILL